MLIKMQKMKGSALLFPSERERERERERVKVAEFLSSFHLENNG
jgi:hypothetical protein